MRFSGIIKTTLRFSGCLQFNLFIIRKFCFSLNFVLKIGKENLIYNFRKIYIKIKHFTTLAN